MGEKPHCGNCENMVVKLSEIERKLCDLYDHKHMHKMFNSLRKSTVVGDDLSQKSSVIPVILKARLHLQLLLRFLVRCPFLMDVKEWMSYKCSLDEVTCTQNIHNLSTCSHPSEEENRT